MNLLEKSSFNKILENLHINYQSPMGIPSRKKGTKEVIMTFIDSSVNRSSSSFIHREKKRGRPYYAKGNDDKWRGCASSSRYEFS